MPEAKKMNLTPRRLEILRWIDGAKGSYSATWTAKTILAFEKEGLVQIHDRYVSLTDKGRRAIGVIP